MKRQSLPLSFLSNRLYDDAVARKDGQNDARRCSDWRSIVRGRAATSGEATELIRIFSLGMPA
jgi:hypothetical protein